MGLEKTLGSPVQGKKFFDRKHVNLDRGNWPTKGDAVLEAFANHDKPVVLAMWPRCWCC